MKDFEQIYSAYVDCFNEYLTSFFDNFKNCPLSLKEAMRYSAENGGKRVRPVIALASADMLNVDKKEVLDYALAIELIHTYSLIHDDLPSMDNDDYRRGKLSSHKMFGEATAILTGDALLNTAMEILISASTNSKRLDASKAVAFCAGASGMIAGQIYDMQSQTLTDFNKENLEKIYINKTAKLILAPLVAVSKLAGGKSYDELSNYGYNLGMLFQITDDLMDLEGSLEEIGKTPHKDEEENKYTSVKVFGAEGAKREAESYYDNCKKILQGIENSAFLQDFTDKMYKRKK